MTLGTSEAVLSSEPAAPATLQPGVAARVVLATALALLGALPLYRLLARPVTGLAGSATVGMAADYASFLWRGTLLLAVPALLAARLLSPLTVRRGVDRIATWLGRPRLPLFGLGLALAASLLAVAFSGFALHFQPALVDASSQLLQARYLAAGHWAGPVDSLQAFRQIQQTLVTPAGWVSQYPPGHLLLLAAGASVGAVWLVGPVLLAATAATTVAVAQRLLPGHPALARLAGVLTAISPFLVAHAGAYMSHTTAAAAAVLAVYLALRATAGPAPWAVVAGAAAGLLFATRPLSGVVMGVVVVAILAGLADPGRRTARRVAARWCWFAVGVLPFALGVALYNAHFFGDPFRFGYQVALGPAGGLGFGIDPWGNVYRLREALGYTSAELTALSLFLLEVPAPLVLLVGLFLGLAVRLDPGTRVIALWALLPLAANLLYWHHGLFMGPRMLNEVAPAWILLVVVALSALVRMLPERSRRLPAYSPRVFLTTYLLLGGLVGVGLLAPLRLASYARGERGRRIAREAGPHGLVFVHEGWAARLSMRLAAAGMRLDSVETALRVNPTCAVEQFADHSGSSALDFQRRATALPPQVQVLPGVRARVRPGEVLTPVCLREARADRFGALDLAPLLWLGDLPGLPGDGVMFVRDLGPQANARLRARYPDRRPLLLLPSHGAQATLVPYAAGMQRLWGGGASAY